MMLEWIRDETLPESVTEKMQAAANQCVESEGVSIPCAATVRLCGDEEIARINTAYRAVNKATDVLSFPTVRYPEVAASAMEIPMPLSAPRVVPFALSHSPST